MQIKSISSGVELQASGEDSPWDFFLFSGSYVGVPLLLSGRESRQRKPTKCWISHTHTKKESIRGKGVELSLASWVGGCHNYHFSWVSLEGRGLWQNLCRYVGDDFVGQATSLPIEKKKGDKSCSNWCLGTRIDGQKEYTYKRGWVVSMNTHTRQNALVGGEKIEQRGLICHPMSHYNETTPLLGATSPTILLLPSLFHQVSALSKGSQTIQVVG